MKLASFNVENLFLRAKAMNLESLAEGKPILQAQAEINALLAKATYTAADKKRILSLLDQLGLKKSDDGPFAILRQNRGHLVKRGAQGPTVVANGRADWIGWVELEREMVNEVATRNTAQVIRDVDADVLGVIEAESRPALLRFAKEVLPEAGGSPYAHIMLIDGNDDRGIDVGILTRPAFGIDFMRSHVDDSDADGRIFSRDCAEYHLTTAKGSRLVVLVNHFKSKGFGGAAASAAKRRRQAERVAAIYAGLHAAHPLIAVIGDLNDTPDSQPLKPLLAAGLVDIGGVAGFDDGGRPGTYANGTKTNKIDFILMSPQLRAKATAGGIFRMGVWGGTNGTLFPHYPEITKEAEAASDHAAIWADLDI
ncbi:MAG: endonuclease/exonuclease/phosphatase family protein [Bauldia sp.]